LIVVEFDLRLVDGVQQSGHENSLGFEGSRVRGVKGPF
jgi:hypothetical protein